MAKDKVATLPPDVNPNYVPPPPFPGEADRRRLVNRLPRLSAVAKIIDVLSEFGPAERAAILRAVNELLNEQPTLPFEAGEAKP